MSRVSGFQPHGGDGKTAADRVRPSETHTTCSPQTQLAHSWPSPAAGRLLGVEEASQPPRPWHSACQLCPPLARGTSGSMGAAGSVSSWGKAVPAPPSYAYLLLPVPARPPAPQIPERAGCYPMALAAPQLPGSLRMGAQVPGPPAPGVSLHHLCLWPSPGVSPCSHSSGHVSRMWAELVSFLS